MPIGAAVPAGTASNSLLKSPERQALANYHFNQLTAENIMKMDALSTEPDTWNFADADALINHARSQGQTVHGHTLLWHRALPGWTASAEGDAQRWQQRMTDHITAVAGHFHATAADTLVSWDVVNEAFEDEGAALRGSPAAASNSRDNLWYEKVGPTYIEQAFQAAHQAAPNAELYYNDFNLEWNATKLNAVIAMVQDFLARGIPIHGVGFQGHIWASNAISQWQAHMARVAAIDPRIKIKITELDVRFNHVTPPLRAADNTLYQRHREIIYQVVQAYLTAVPPAQRGGISLWGLIDGDSWILPLYGLPDWPLLFFNDYTPKPAFQGFVEALQAESPQL
jgi:endo-1,4-beta-xylanase